MSPRALLIPGPAALLALYLGVRLGLSPLKHYDLFFHLAGGRYVLEHGFNRVDPFSLTGTAGWVPHEWGFGVFCVLLVKVLGAAGPALLTGALVAANALLLFQYELFMKGYRTIAPYPHGPVDMWLTRFVVPVRVLAQWLS